MAALVERAGDVNVVAMHSLPELEAVIETHIGAFMKVGNALMEIRDRHLYQERGYDRFEDYCSKRFEMSRQHAYRLIDAAKTLDALAVSPIGDTPLPTSEGHVRELVPLMKKDPQAAAAVWHDVYEATDGKPHIMAIRQAVQEIKRREETVTTAVVNASVDKSRDATQERREQIRRMVGEGYRDDQIADRVGIAVGTVKHIIGTLDLPNQTERLGGKTKRIDHNRALTGLIESCTPTPESVNVIDWAQLDPEGFPEWDRAVSDAIQILTRLRNQIRKRLTEDTNGR